MYHLTDKDKKAKLKSLKTVAASMPAHDYKEKLKGIRVAQLTSGDLGTGKKELEGVSPSRPKNRSGPNAGVEMNDSEYAAWLKEQKHKEMIYTPDPIKG